MISGLRARIDVATIYSCEESKGFLKKISCAVVGGVLVMRCPDEVRMRLSID